MTSNVLPLFWPLSNSSKETRLAASASLVSSLESFQQSFSQNVGSSKGKEIEDEDEDSASDSEESGMEVDASDDEEENNERDSQAAKLDRQLSKDNAEDVVYSVKRLVRGLGSSRESSRLGFAVALTEVINSSSNACAYTDIRTVAFSYTNCHCTTSLLTGYPQFSLQQEYERF